MNTQEIREILSCSVPKSYRTTVLPADKLNAVSSQQFAIVANSQNSNQPGMHWIAMFKNRRSKEVEFFDSCAMPIDFYSPTFEAFLGSKADIIRMSALRIQPGTSNACGHFSIYYLLHRVRGTSFEQILQSFDEFDLESNDRIVREFVGENFHSSNLLVTKKQNTLQELGSEVSTIIQCCEILEQLLQL
jgi:hypothetical protein